jgi:hypothetical protein
VKRWLALVLLVFLGACSSTGSSPTNSPAPAQSQTGGAPSTESAKAGPSGSTPDCPLTADQVTSVLGEPMKADNTAGACAFVPQSGNLFPNVSYNKQYSFIFDDLASEYYTEKLSGVGDRAYIKRRGDGTWIVAEVGSKTFEVRVDSNDANRDRGFAVALAKLVVGML